MPVPEHHLRVGPKALHVMYWRGPANTAHTLSGGSWSKAWDWWSCNKRVLLALVLCLSNGLVRVHPVPGAFRRRVVQRPRHRGWAVAGANEGTGVVGVRGTAALSSGGKLVVACCYWAVTVPRRVYHDGIRVFLGQRLLADSQER